VTQNTTCIEQQEREVTFDLPLSDPQILLKKMQRCQIIKTSHTKPVQRDKERERETEPQAQV